MNRAIIFEFEREKGIPFSGEQLIPKVHHVEDIRPAFDEASSMNRVFTIWLDNTLLSLSDIRLDDSFEGIPMLFHVYNVGDLYTVMSDIDCYKRLNMRVFISSSRKENFTSLKILSSLGIDCGILLDSKSINDDSFVDLASYFYLSQVPHASIEPFDFIWRNLHSEKNLDFSTVYFYNPEKYVFANPELELAFSEEDLQSKRFIGKYHPQMEVSFDSLYKEKELKYYDHFMALDACSKCPSFKICNRKIYKQFANCSAVFDSVYEYAGILDEIERKRNNTKELCQL